MSGFQVLPQKTPLRVTDLPGVFQQVKLLCREQLENNCFLNNIQPLKACNSYFHENEQSLTCYAFLIFIVNNKIKNNYISWQYSEGSEKLICEGKGRVEAYKVCVCMC